MIDIRELSRQLGDHASGICQELFPDGKIESGCYKVGSISGEKGRSMSVYLHGEQAGKYMDFATGEGGDMLDLIQHAKGLTLVEAMEWSKKRFNVRDNVQSKKFSAVEKKTFQLPNLPEQSSSQLLHGYMEGRGFRDVGEICFKWKIYETTSHRGSDVVFPYYGASGELVFLKTKPINHDGNPSTQKDLKPILYGWHCMPDNAREVWLVEGEWDAIACSELGYPALSVPFGGGKGAKQTKWIENEYDNLSRFERILIATDMDEQGELAAAEIMTRLGERCVRINLPNKDINDILKGALV